LAFCSATSDRSSSRRRSALEAQERREILGVPRRLTLEECQLAELRVEVLREALFVRVHRREVLGHAQGLRVPQLRHADRLLQEQAEDLRGLRLRFGCVRERGAELDELDVPV